MNAMIVLLFLLAVIMTTGYALVPYKKWGALHAVNLVMLIVLILIGIVVYTSLN